MKTTLDYLNDVKAKTGAASDYALSKELGVSRQAISDLRLRNGHLSDETCLKVASILEIEPSEVILSIHFEKSKTDTVRSAYKTIFERLGGVAASVLIASSLMSSPTPAKAEGAQLPNNVYYVKSRKRRKIPNPLEFLVSQLIQV